MTERHHDEPDELPSDISEMLEGERGAPALPDAHRDALWDKLDKGLNVPPAPTASTFTATALRMLPVALVSAVAGASMHAYITQTPVVPTTGHVAPSASAVVTEAPTVPDAMATVAYASAQMPSVAPPIASAPPSSWVRVPSESSSAAAAATASASFGTTVTPTEERALIERGRAALARRDWLSALEALRERDKAYPQGALREERDALEVQALALAGRSDDARSKARAFLKRYPGSVFTLKIESLERELGR